MSVELVFREAERSASQVKVQELKSLCGGSVSKPSSARKEEGSIPR
jgi:hypothetical protein